MRINASAGRDRKKCLTDFCYSLTLKADHPNPESASLEGEFLSLLYKEIRDGNTGYWLGRLRRARAKVKGANDGT